MGARTSAPRTPARRATHRASASAKATADKPRTSSSRSAIFTAASELFSARGFDGVIVDDIALRAGVNKAMIYYHFADKVALYREVVGDMLRATGARVAEIAARPIPPPARIEAFVAAFVALADERPWFPTLMLREVAEGAPHLDAGTLGLMRTVFAAFATILADGRTAGDFRPVNPVLAYMSIIGPLLLNAARERAAAAPGRRKLPMFVDVPHPDLTAHMQQAALRILSSKS